MKRKVAFLFIVFLTSSVLSHAEYAIDYFPLSPGNSWNYRVTNNLGVSTTTWTILQGFFNINGVDTRSLLDSKENQQMFITNDAYGIRQHGTYSQATAPPVFQAFIPPYKFAEAQTTFGAPIYGSGTVNTTVYGYGTYPLNYQSFSNVVGSEVVTVPAGTFSAIKVSAVLYAFGTVLGQPISEYTTETFWMAKGVGVIKQITTDSMGTDTFELTSTNVVYTTPNPFTFTPQIDTPLSTPVTSNSITVIGTTGAAPISIIGGDYRIGSGPWTSAQGTVTNGQTVTVRQTSAATINTQTTATLSIGGVTSGFNVTTITPRVALTPAYLRFVELNLGATTAPQTLIVTNNGTAPLTVSTISLPPDFAQTNDCTGGTIVVGGTCTIDVTFTPTANGIRKGPLTIHSNGAGSPHFERVLGVGGTVPPQAIGIFRTGAWYVDLNGDGTWSGCRLSGPDGCADSFGGLSIDIPFMGDWDGNGNPRMGIYRQGYWYLDLNGSGTWNGCEPGGTDRCWGPFGGYFSDIPVVGDWNGDGKTKIGIYRQGMWYLDMNANGAWDGCSVDACLGPFGGLDIDLPVVGDWNGNGLTKIGIYRQGLWYLDKDGSGTWGGCGIDDCLGPFGGFSFDIPVVGDWSGNAISRIGIYRLGGWYLDASGNGQWNGCLPTGTDKCVSAFGGLSIDKPVVK